MAKASATVDAMRFSYTRLVFCVNIFIKFANLIKSGFEYIIICIHVVIPRTLTTNDYRSSDPVATHVHE